MSGAEVVLGEMLAAVVHHAPGPCDVITILKQPYLCIEVMDRGPGVEMLRFTGMGLMLIEAHSLRHATFERRGGGAINVAIVRMRERRDLPAP